MLSGISAICSRRAVGLLLAVSLAVAAQIMPAIGDELFAASLTAQAAACAGQGGTGDC